MKKSYVFSMQQSKKNCNYNPENIFNVRSFQDLIKNFKNESDKIQKKNYGISIEKYFSQILQDLLEGLQLKFKTGENNILFELISFTILFQKNKENQISLNFKKIKNNLLKIINFFLEKNISGTKTFIIKEYSSQEIIFQEIKLNDQDDQISLYMIQENIKKFTSKKNYFYQNDFEFLIAAYIVLENLPEKEKNKNILLSFFETLYNIIKKI